MGTSLIKNDNQAATTTPPNIPKDTDGLSQDGVKKLKSAGIEGPNVTQEKAVTAETLPRDATPKPELASASEGIVITDISLGDNTPSENVIETVNNAMVKYFKKAGHSDLINPNGSINLGAAFNKIAADDLSFEEVMLALIQVLQDLKFDVAQNQGLQIDHHQRSRQLANDVNLKNIQEQAEQQEKGKKAGTIGKVFAWVAVVVTAPLATTGIGATLFAVTLAMAIDTTMDSGVFDKAVSGMAKGLAEAFGGDEEKWAIAVQVMVVVVMAVVGFRAAGAASRAAASGADDVARVASQGSGTLSKTSGLLKLLNMGAKSVDDVAKGALKQFDDAIKAAADQFKSLGKVFPEEYLDDLPKELFTGISKNSDEAAQQVNNAAAKAKDFSKATKDLRQARADFANGVTDSAKNLDEALEQFAEARQTFRYAMSQVEPKNSNIAQIFYNTTAEATGGSAVTLLTKMQNAAARLGIVNDIGQGAHGIRGAFIQKALDDLQADHLDIQGFIATIDEMISQLFELLNATHSSIASSEDAFATFLTGAHQARMKGATV